jgi:hypothetical protein
MKYWNTSIAFQAWCLTAAFLTGYAATRGNFDYLAAALAWVMMFYMERYSEEGKCATDPTKQ